MCIWHNYGKDIGLEIENKTQWHPAFCTSMELELMENQNGLSYEREYNLSSEPLQIDLLVIKKNPNEIIKNKIGKFFLGHNILEFKSPDDKMNIDTFYKVLSYACLYKSDTGAVDEVLDTDITITLIREQKPVKLLRQLSEKYDVITEENGIYYIDKMLFPLQIVVTKELSGSGHIWLKALTRSMDIKQAEELLNRYESLPDDSGYRSKAGTIVNLASDVNDAVFKQIILGGGSMSNELKEMLMPELAELKQILAGNQVKLAENQAELAEKDALIEENKAELAKKDALIAELKHMLAEASQDGVVFKMPN